LALSGLILRRESRDSKPTSSSNDAGAEGLEQGNTEASPAVRHLRRGMILDYGNLSYNTRLDKATGRPQLTTQVRLFRDGKEVFAGKEQPLDASRQVELKRLTTGGAIQLGADMTPGEYVLQVTVTDQLADPKHRTATQWMDFEIVK